MGKESGLGDQLYIDGVNMSGYIGTITNAHGGPTNTQDMTGIDKFAHERVGLELDGGLSFMSYHDSAANTNPQVTNLSALPTIDRLVCYHHGTVAGVAGAGCMGIQISYDPNRAADGSLTIATEVVADQYGLQWGTVITPGIRTDTTAGNGTSYDLVAASSTGWTAYLQVFSITGTSVTLTLQDSADNSSFTNLSGGAFTAATAKGAQLRSSNDQTATVREYVRVVSSGTFTNAQFSVLLCPTGI